MLYNVTIVLHHTKNNKNSQSATRKDFYHSKGVNHDKFVQSSF